AQRALRATLRPDGGSAKASPRPRSYRPSSPEEENDRENQADDEQNPRDVRRGARDAGESEHAGDQCDDQKYHCPVNHAASFTAPNSGLSRLVELEVLRVRELASQSAHLHVLLDPPPRGLLLFHRIEESVEVEFQLVENVHRPMLRVVIA